MVIFSRRSDAPYALTTEKIEKEGERKTMSTAREGLYAVVDINGVAVGLLRGVTFHKEQSMKRFYECGTLHPSVVLRGPIREEGTFKRAFTQTGLAGTLNVGTYNAVGTIYLRGGATPYMAGTFLFNSLDWTNMNAEDESAVEEEFGFIIYNVTFG